MANIKELVELGTGAQKLVIIAGGIALTFGVLGYVFDSLGNNSLVAQAKDVFSASAGPVKTTVGILFLVVLVIGAAIMIRALSESTTS